MSKVRIWTFVLPLAVILLSACSLDTDNDPGSLEGMWHLTRIENIMSGKVTAVEKLDNKYIFWSFQAKLLELDDKSGAHRSYLYRFSVDNGVLKLSSPYLYDRENGDKALNTYELEMAVYGLRMMTPVYKIERNSKGRLVLTDGGVRLYFRKF